MLNRVERHVVQNNKRLNQLCWLSKNLYNYANYCIRQSFINTGKLPNEYELINKFTKRNQVDYRRLPAQTSQQIIKLLFKNWKCFFETIKDYKKHSNKYKARPKMPQYKSKNGQNIVLFTGQQCKIRYGYIKFPKEIFKKIKTNVDNIVQVRIVPQATCHIIEVVYRKESKLCKNLKNENVLGVDLGLNNLATCVNNVGLKPFIINGKPLKSINQYCNKKRAKYLSYVGVRGKSNNCDRIILKRNNRVSNYLHHASRYIINYCLKYAIGTIVVGHNKGWKQSINNSDIVNQNFVNIPFNTLIHQLKYKAEEVGINVIEIEESYTSKTDHLAYETMEYHSEYLGKRIKRGCFKSSVGVTLNADVNGAIGIARKVIGDSFVREIIDRGQAFCPIRLDLNVCSHHSLVKNDSNT